MPSDPEPPPYTRYRAGRLPGRGGGDELPARGRQGGPGEAPDEQPLGSGAVATPPRPVRPRVPRPPAPGGSAGGSGGGRSWRHLVPERDPSERGRPGRWRAWLRPKRVIAGVILFVIGWLVLSLVLFLASSHFERKSPPLSVKGALNPGGNLLTSANNILVLGSDRRQKDSKEPGADTSGPSRSDTIMLIRTGGGHAARLSIPRDTVVDIPGHGEQKINAAYAFGGPALSISVIEHWLGIPINHMVEVNFENFPQLIDSMGGVNYTGGCVVSRLDGGFSDGGFTLRLPAGTHHIDGQQALALARTRENLCNPLETDIQRDERQQALFNDMKDRLESLSSLVRLPLIAWNAPPAIISDMSGPQLLEMFAALAMTGTPPTRVLEPSGNVILPEGGEGLEVSESERRHAVAQFMRG